MIYALFSARQSSYLVNGLGVLINLNFFLHLGTLNQFGIGYLLVCLNMVLFIATIYIFLINFFIATKLNVCTRKPKSLISPPFSKALFLCGSSCLNCYAVLFFYICLISDVYFFLQYIHGLAARGVHYLHRPGPLLQDIGFLLLPVCINLFSFFSQFV